MIASLETITSGDLYIGAGRVNEVDPRDRNLAFVFQNYALFPHMTFEGNLAFGMRIRGHGRGEIETRVREVAHLLGIGELLARKPGELSGGQRQRVALGLRERLGAIPSPSSSTSRSRTWMPSCASACAPS
jgi:ABC-type sugar transport system ATPase subunit